MKNYNSNCYNQTDSGKKQNKNWHKPANQKTNNKHLAPPLYIPHGSDETLIEGAKGQPALLGFSVSYYMTFQDFVNMLMIKLEENIKLNQDIKEKLIIELENIYNKSAKETVLEISNIAPDKFIDFVEPDYRSIEYALKLHFYLEKFFQRDKELRKRVVNWLTQYYLQEGNPIRGQEGVKESLKQFERYIKPQTEWKARQINVFLHFEKHAKKLGVNFIEEYK